MWRTGSVQFTWCSPSMESFCLCWVLQLWSSTAWLSSFLQGECLFNHNHLTVTSTHWSLNNLIHRWIHIWHLHHQCPHLIPVDPRALLISFTQDGVVSKCRCPNLKWSPKNFILFSEILIQCKSPGLPNDTCWWVWPGDANKISSNIHPQHSEISNPAIPFRPCMKSATNTVLMGMAACDLVTIILPAPW